LKSDSMSGGRCPGKGEGKCKRRTSIFRSAIPCLTAAVEERKK
jgi:hypothetical protein